MNASSVVKEHLDDEQFRILNEIATISAELMGVAAAAKAAGKTPEEQAMEAGKAAAAAAKR